MTERPTELKVGPHMYTIVWDTQTVLDHSRACGEDEFGFCKPGEGIIAISPGRPPSFLKETLVHEWLHVILWENDIDVPENPEANAHDREEKLVGQLGGLWLAALKDNEPVVRWLLNEE